MTARVILWGTVIGYVSDGADGVAAFEYDRDFLRSGIQVAPITMPLGPGVRSFPDLASSTYRGLPGLLADSLPDRFGTALIRAWAERTGGDIGDLSGVAALCYMGSRGMGALEYLPAHDPDLTVTDPLDIGELAALADRVLRERAGFSVDATSTDALQRILSVGSSAGGARAKAVVMWNAATGEMRSGQAPHVPGFEHWILKFDGVSENRDRELADPIGHTRVEFAYSLMAREAGIAMPETRLLHEGGRSHFMAKRFDRTPDGGKVHMQTLNGLAHFDFNMARVYGYEDAMRVALRIDVPPGDRAELYRRMVFNVLARNQDDHTKNISFLMGRDGRWRLSPAYDVTYAYNPAGRWTGTHQMLVNGRADGFTTDDLLAVASHARLKAGQPQRIIREVTGAVRNWPRHGEEAGVPQDAIRRIGEAHRLALAP